MIYHCYIYLLQMDIFFVIIPNGKVVDDMIELDFLEQGIQNIVTWK